MTISGKVQKYLMREQMARRLADAADVQPSPGPDDLPGSRPS